MGFIYAIVGLGVYITYKILDFPDLTVDGSFPLGGVVFSVLLVNGCPWYVGMVAAFAAGAVAGFVTGLLHVKLKRTAVGDHHDDCIAVGELSDRGRSAGSIFADRYFAAQFDAGFASADGGKLCRSIVCIFICCLL